MKDNTERRTDLQAAVRQEDEHSPSELRDLFEAHADMVFRAAYRVTGNGSDAEDVVQTVFTRLIQGGYREGLDLNPGPYLRRAAINAAVDVIRKRKRRRAVDLEKVEPILSEDSGKRPDRISQGRELATWLRAAVAELSPRAAEVFSLRYFEGYDNKDIAEMLGTSESTIAVTLHRARNRLQEELQSFTGGKQ